MTFEQSVKWVLDMDGIDIDSVYKDIFLSSEEERASHQRLQLIDLLHRFYTQEAGKKEIVSIFDIQEGAVVYFKYSISWYINYGWKFRKPLPELLKDFNNNNQ